MMKTVTLNVDEEAYKRLQSVARKAKRSTSDVVREAMNLYLSQQTVEGKSLRNLSPYSAGSILKPLSLDDDLLGEMTGD